MIYKTLDQIPYKLFMVISADSSKLPDLAPDRTVDQAELEKFWTAIEEEYLALKGKTSEQKRYFAIEKEIEALNCKMNFVKIALHGLRFEWDDELATMLEENGYPVHPDLTQPDIDRMLRSLDGIKIKISELRNRLPKPEQADKPVNLMAEIDEMFAFYSAALGGMDFDYNTVSVTKVLGLEKQIQLKIKSLEKQLTQTQKTAKRR